MDKTKIFLIECCNFVDYPTGGQLTFAKHLIKSFGQELVLIGITNNKKNVGRWNKLVINGIEHDYFPYLYLPIKLGKPIIPLRILNYIALRKYKNSILKKGYDNVIIQSPEALIAIKDFNFKNICYRFAGTENPLIISRYRLAHIFSFLYDRYFFPQLSKIQLILAAADSNSIDELVIRAKGKIQKDKVIQFSTRVDTNIFKKADKNISRKILSIPDDKIVIVTTGRLGWFKGWKFMIDSFVLFKLTHPEAQLIFIGNGEDHDKILNYINILKQGDSIFLIGYKVSTIISQYLNAADLYIMGSYKEGWSTSLLEAICCGTPVCVTNFGSAKEIINVGVNGYISELRDEALFATLMNKSLSIERLNLPEQTNVERYAAKNLKFSLLNLWSLKQSRISRIAIIEPCNFTDYPNGGQLTFAKQLVAEFGNELTLIGITTEKEKIGSWTKKIINNIEYDFFPYLYMPRYTKKPIIPLRFRNYLALRKQRNEISKHNLTNVITQSPESLLAILDQDYSNLCYYFAGTENPLVISRYKFAHWIAFLYDKYFLPKLSKVQLILAAADLNAINELIIRSKGSIKRENVIQFPTRVDTGIFKKLNKNISKNKLSLKENKIVIVTTGRLGWFKGWKFMIDSFKIFQISYENAEFYFLGDGEDFDAIYSYIKKMKLEDSVHLVGSKFSEEIVLYLNAADIFIMGSFKEGWSTSLLEALACGIPACVTDFSSAREILQEGITGYVSDARNEQKFAELMRKCLVINTVNLPILADIEKYAQNNLKNDLLKIWPII